MNLWERVTGSDMTKAMKAFEPRAEKLPADYRAAWEQNGAGLWQYTDSTGETSCRFLTARSACSRKRRRTAGAPGVLGGDIQNFCAALACEEGAESFRDRWRAQLNRHVAKKSGK